MRIIHTADLHLDSQLKTNLSPLKQKERRRELLLNLERLIEYAKNQRVKVIIIAGDLFDDTSISDLYLKELKRVFSKVNFKIIISPGNHDPFTPDSPYNTNWPKNVFIFKSLKMEKISFPEYDLDIWGSAFQGPYKSQSFMNLSDVDKSKINLCVIHGNLSNSENDDYCPISAGYIESSGMDYIALGHIHKRSNIGCVGRTQFAYPGCPEGSGFDEPGEKGFYIGTIAKGICELQFKKVCRRTYENLEINISNLNSECDIIDKILDHIQNEFGPNYLDNIYRIRLTGETSEDFFVDINGIESQVNDKVFFVKLIDETETEIDAEKLKFRNDFKSIFIKKMLVKIETSITDEEKDANKLALKLGLKAFERDVKYS